jgi:microcystin-dependent protein
MLPGLDAEPLRRPTRGQKKRAAAAGLIGEVKMWPLATAPDGHLVCNGQAVSRQVYAALFAVIGTTWGAGDGSTTFNVPNYVDRMPIGSGNLYALAATGGSKDSITVSHSHTASSVVTDPGHVHSQNGNTLYFAGASTVNTAGPSFSANTQVLNTGLSATGIAVATTVNSTGASGTNANLPPYLGMNFIIKT